MKGINWILAELCFSSLTFSLLVILYEETIRTNIFKRENSIPPKRDLA